MCSRATIKRPAAVAGLGITIISFGLQLLSLVTDQWLVLQAANSTTSSRSGIWFSWTLDTPTDTDEGAMIACQICGVIGAVLMFECVRIENAVMQSEGCRKSGIKMFIFTNGLGCACMLAEFLVFVISTGMEYAELGPSCKMTMAAFLLSVFPLCLWIFAFLDELRGKCSHTVEMEEWQNRWGVCSCRAKFRWPAAVAGLVMTVICFSLQSVAMVTDQWQIREADNSTLSSRTHIWFSLTNDVLTDYDESVTIACQVFGIFGAVLMFELMRVEHAMMQSGGCREHSIVVFLVLNVLGSACMLAEFLVLVIRAGLEHAEFGHSCKMIMAAFLLSVFPILFCIIAYFDELRRK